MFVEQTLLLREIDNSQFLRLLKQRTDAVEQAACGAAVEDTVIKAENEFGFQFREE